MDWHVEADSLPDHPLDPLSQLPCQGFYDGSDVHSVSSSSSCSVPAEFVLSPRDLIPSSALGSQVVIGAPYVDIGEQFCR